MENNKTEIYIASVFPLENQELYKKAYEYVSPQRRRKADSYRFEKDKRLSLGAGLLLQYGLQQRGLNSSSVCFKNGLYGKPYIDNSNLFFNISHSGEWVVCAVSDIEVGCDIEKIESANLSIAEKFFSPEEYSSIKHKTKTDQNLLFYRYWTLKESFIKATGLGMSVGFDSFEINLEYPVSIKQSYDERNYRFIEFHEIPGYCCAVCFKDNLPQVSLNIIDIGEIL